MLDCFHFSRQYSADHYGAALAEAVVAAVLSKSAEDFLGSLISGREIGKLALFQAEVLLDL